MLQVLVTNQECVNEPRTTCTDSVTLLYQEHTIQLRRSEAAQTVIASLDGNLVDKFPVYLPWTRMEKLPGEEVTVLLLAVQVEVSYYFHNFAFSVRLPSQLYLNKTEGLCGNCNGDQSDDFCRPDGALTTDTDQFGLSWLASSLVGGPGRDLFDEDNCQALQDDECVPLPPDEDQCLKLVDSSLFQVCNAVVDPMPYVSACQFDQCRSADRTASSCHSMEAYARECAKMGVCLAWRSPDLCPVDCGDGTGMEYRQCGSGCVSNCDSFQQQQQQQQQDACVMSVADGCFCPDGQAFNEALKRCVSADHCVPCDADGHYRGDQWQEDACSSCSCDENGRVKCTTRTCVLETCQLGEQRHVIDAPADQCCPSVVCTPPTAEELDCPANASTPACGEHQKLVVQQIAGCLYQICECVPLSECPPLDDSSSSSSGGPFIVLVGEKYVTNTTGCCPRWDRVCVPEECPEKPACPKFYERAVTAASRDLCCPEYYCQPPADACVYQHQHQQHQHHHPKATKRYGVEATWSDGPCVQCRCHRDDFHSAVPRHICEEQACPEIVDDDYVLEARNVSQQQCCPQYVRTACKQDDRVHEVLYRFLLSHLHYMS